MKIFSLILPVLAILLEISALDQCELQPNNVKFPGESCENYYVCQEKISQNVTCPGYLHFSNDDSKCTWPQDAKCTNSLQTPSISKYYCSGEATRSKIPSRSSCSHYIDCDDPVTEVNCGSTYVFVPVEGGCRDKNKYLCDPDAAIKPHCRPSDEGKFIPDQTDCNGYFYCLNGIPLEDNCGKGLYFDRVRKVCDYEENVICMLDSVIENPEVCKGKNNGLVADPLICYNYYDCSNGISHSCLPSQGIELYFNQETQNCSPIRPKRCTCEGRPYFIKIQDPTDPNKYFECTETGPKQHVCPYGYIFNELKERCQLESVF